MIQHQMQFDRSLGLAELRPVIHGQTKVNDRGIQADQLVLETKLLLSSHLIPAKLKEIEEDLLIKFPRPVLIGIG